jgi:hypothetical protein
LVDQFGFTGSYQSVKRLVRKLRGSSTPQPRAVIEPVFAGVSFDPRVARGMSSLQSRGGVVDQQIGPLGEGT